MKETLYIAVDLGAGSGRVFLGDPGERFLLEEIHRFGYPPRQANGHLRWDFAKIFGEIKFGLKKAGERAKVLNKQIYSIGVDSWGVDYGLLDAAGNLLADPVCYRDARTNSAPEKVLNEFHEPRSLKNRNSILKFQHAFSAFFGRRNA